MQFRRDRVAPAARSLRQTLITLSRPRDGLRFSVSRRLGCATEERLGERVAVGEQRRLRADVPPRQLDRWWRGGDSNSRPTDYETVALAG